MATGICIGGPLAGQTVERDGTFTEGDTTYVSWQIFALRIWTPNDKVDVNWVMNTLATSYAEANFEEPPT
jgi:hypothetical protein